jgi:hypothetical protein
MGALSLLGALGLLGLRVGMAAVNEALKNSPLEGLLSLQIRFHHASACCLILPHLQHNIH